MDWVVYKIQLEGYLVHISHHWLMKSSWIQEGINNILDLRGFINKNEMFMVILFWAALFLTLRYTGK